MKDTKRKMGKNWYQEGIRVVTSDQLDLDTAQTPAFPAGHTFQAYYLSKYLSKKYPKKKEIFENIAKECDLTRVKAGLHYPSDGEFSKKLVDILF